jgi:hypothetical protein
MAEGTGLQAGRDEGREAPDGSRAGGGSSSAGTQELTRIDESGVREEFVRVPVELLIEEPEG